MNQIPIKLGPLALLLTVISICLTTLSILTFTTARADRRLAEKYADTVTERYDLMNRGQEFLAYAETALAEGTPLNALPGTYTDESGVAWYEEEEGDMRLTVGIAAGADGPEVVEYRVSKDWSEDLDLGNLWTGFGF